MPELAALLLAAGGSSRLGQPKQLLDCQGQPLVRRSARLLQSLCPRPVVVTGAQRKACMQALSGLRLREVHHDQWQRGMGSSLAAGIAALDAGVGGVLVMLCDQYRLAAADLLSLADAWQRSPEKVVAAHWTRNFGPPAIFPRPWFGRLQQLDAEGGARGLLESYRDEVLLVKVPGAAYDVDAPQDLERMLRWLKTRAAAPVSGTSA